METLKLTINNKINHLPVAMSFVASAAEAFGLQEEDISNIKIGSGEAFTNAIKYAYLEGDEGEIFISVVKLTSGIKIIIRDLGLPTDPSELKAYDTENIDNFNEQAFAKYLTESMFDKVNYNNLGKHGHETVLIKYDYSKRVQTTDKEEEKLNKQKPVTDFNFAIQDLEASKTLNLAKLVYHDYRYSYPYETVYYPERFAEMILNGEVISKVAALDNGEIIAHAAAVMPEEGSNSCEFGMAMTRPEYQGAGVMKKITHERMETVKRISSISGIFTQAVSSHPYSQKNIMKWGFGYGGLLVSRIYPVDFKGINESQNHRESVFLMYNFLRDSELIAYRIKEHQNIIEKIFDNLGAKVEYIDAPEMELPDDDIIQSKTEKYFNSATIKVLKTGKGTGRAVGKQLRKFKISGIDTIYLQINMNDPNASKLISAVERHGFFFAGIFPGRFHNQIIFQYLNNQEYDYSQIKPATDFAEELKSYIIECNQKADDIWQD